MKTRAYKTGFTLVEIVAVIAIIAILVSMVLHISRRIGDHVRERLCRETIILIGNALEQFRDFGYEYRDTVHYAGIAFPVDCNGFNAAPLTYTIESTQGFVIGTVSINFADPDQKDNSSSEALYYFLSQVPDCRKTLDKIDKSLISNKTKNCDELRLVISASVSYPLYRIIDPWGTALRYDYYQKDATWYPIPDTKRTFPVITSAGPDKIFDTADDITNIN
jgi:prepilin-type N-terminal cleavage/methylation domain-containing protein